MARRRNTPERPGPSDAYRYVDSSAGLRDVVGALVSEPRYALDTEFHRERTYRPQAALIQIAWPGDLVLIDPLAVDMAPLAEVFAAGGLMVAHAAGQDLEVLEHCCGAVPERIFDTQIAPASWASAPRTGDPVRERDRLEAPQGGPAHRLAGAAAQGVAARLRGRRRHAPSGDPRPARGPAGGVGPAGVGRGRVRAAAGAKPPFAAARGRLVPAQGGAPSEAPRPAGGPVGGDVARAAGGQDQPARSPCPVRCRSGVDRAGRAPHGRGAGQGARRRRGRGPRPAGEGHPPSGYRRAGHRLAPAPEAPGALGGCRPLAPRGGAGHLLGEPARPRPV